MFGHHTWRVLSLALLVCASHGLAVLREPVHPRRNVEEFQSVEGKYIRFIIRATNRGEPCIDELEIYGPDQTLNLALASSGARATASGSLPDYGIHQLEWVNDGRYGNGRSWIADRIEGAWIQIELPQVTRINKVIWGRDREGNFIDRLITRYEIQVARELPQGGAAPEHSAGRWHIVASSDDRESLGFGAQLSGGPSMNRSFVNRFAPVGTRLSSEGEVGTREYSIDVWQTSDGLPGNTVTSIAQGSDGYLWIGTLNGLARFDGLGFRVFGEASELPNSRVLSLLAARDGTLWIGTEGGGLVRLRRGVFQAWTRKQGLAGETVHDLAEDGLGRIWAGTEGGLSCWSNGVFVIEAAQSRDPATAVEVGADNALWAVVGARLETQHGTNRLARPEAVEPSSFSSVLALQVGRSGQIWFGGPNGYIGAISNGSVNVFREQPGHLLEAVWALCETKRGEVWAGTANGGLRRLRDGRLISVTTQDGLSDNAVRSVFEDREGNLWVGTVGGGLNRLKERKVRTFTTRDGLTHNVVMSIAEAADGTMWIGSNCGGLTTCRDGVFTAGSPNYLLDNECIWSLLPASDGNLWIGTWGGGLFRLGSSSAEAGPRGALENFVISQAGDDEPVLSLCEASGGGLWIGTMQSGLKRFDGTSLRHETIANLPMNAITALIEADGGVLWIGTGGGGLARFAEGKLKVCTRQNGLPSDFIRTLYRDGTGVLWVGTGGGLARLNARTFDESKSADTTSLRFTAFTRQHGLPDEVISQILEDDQGNLWLGCNQGILQLSRRELDAAVSSSNKRLNVIQYGRAEGMESIECTGGFHPSGLKTRDGKLWFSTVKGLVMVEPDRISANKVPPPVVLDEVTIIRSGPRVSHVRTERFGVADATHALLIEPGVERMEFRFNALSLVAPERNRFRYQLEGLDRGWIESAERVATYTRVPPGSYHFRVLAANNDGTWNESGAALAFIVRPAFWQAWWFRGALVAIILVGCGTMVRYVSVRRLRRKLRSLEGKHLIEKERTRIARDIHDELGASLTRIALLGDLGQKHRDYPDELSADLGKISTTAREAVRAMDAIVWAINPHNDSLDSFANYVSHFAEDFFRLSPIHCRLDIPEDLPEQPLSTEARHQLFLAVKEALNNVVRHSGANEVWLRIRCDDGELQVSVEDDGCGLRAAGESSGDGIGNIRHRLERLGGCLEVSTAPGNGTSLTMRLRIEHHIDSTVQRLGVNGNSSSHH